MTEEHYITLDEIRAIPASEYPFLVFADNIRGIFSLGVKIRTKGSYGHFMWYIRPGIMASQWFWFKEFHLDHFVGCNLKLVNNPTWTIRDRCNLVNAILSDLALPWYSTLYDVPGVIGELLGIRLQLPGAFFCSERGLYLRLVDPGYDLKSPTPTELNAWTKARQDRYKVKGRYSPD